MQELLDEALGAERTRNERIDSPLVNFDSIEPFQ
jgi:hypothetical protein